jgi:hypothetical protein
VVVGLVAFRTVDKTIHRQPGFVGVGLAGGKSRRHRDAGVDVRQPRDQDVLCHRGYAAASASALAGAVSTGAKPPPAVRKFVV